jgi:hypothetical protein
MPRATPEDRLRREADVQPIDLWASADRYEEGSLARRRVDRVGLEDHEACAGRIAEAEAEVLPSTAATPAD